MLVKFFDKRGSGRSSGPIDYLLGKDREREGAKLLRGDPVKTGLLVDSLKFKQKYTAGVLSFEESNTTEENKQKIMDSFVNALLPGMEHRSNIMWVEHRDKDRLELNFLIANVDLESGKRLQPYYHRTDLNRVDAWKELTNDLYDFTSPNAPMKKQTETRKTNESKGRKGIKAEIDASISALYAEGAINSRDDVEKYMKSKGLNVIKKTKTSMTFTAENSEERFRIKGIFYGENFRSRDAIQEQIKPRDGANQRDREQRISDNRERLSRAIKYKSQEYEKRYFRERRDYSRKAEIKNISDKRNNEMVNLGGDIRHNNIGIGCNRLDIFSEKHGMERAISDQNYRGEQLPELQHSSLHIQSTSNVRDRDILRERQTNPERRNSAVPILENIQNDRDRTNIVEFTHTAIERVQQFTKSIKTRVRELHGAISQTFGAELTQHQSSDKNNRAALERAGKENQRDVDTFERNERKVSEIGDRAEQFNRALEQFGERYESLTSEIEERLEPKVKKSFWHRMR